MAKREISRGSLWNQWDLHVHTPASFHWLGKKFEGDLSSDVNKALVDEMIDAMNKAEPAVFAIMDYWTFDGWFALKRRLAEQDSPKLHKKVFPGIELRLSAPTAIRLNAHVVFSDEIPDQHLKDFLADLKIERTGRSVSKDALIALARATAPDMLEKKGHKKDVVVTDDADALLAGYKLAEIKADSYKDAISKVPNGLAIGFMPYDTSDGLAEVKWEEHYSYFLGLLESSPIFESRNLELRFAFLCEETEKNKGWIGNFKHGLKGIPRLVVAGSDAHCFIGTPGDNDKRGYGDFPSGKKTWIKADPSFRGLKQAILEPAKRSFIGQKPPKLQEIESNKVYYIDSLEVAKTGSESDIGKWLDGCDIPLNPDLVAVIGNKGSGKSALADVIATLGNSKQSRHFSFLRKERFLGKAGEPARHFTGTLTWCDESTEARPLNELPSEEKPELVRYIPQGYFEELCNEHVSGKSNAFEKELRAVIFSHTSEEMRLGALDFDQLTEQQEQSLRNRLGEYRKVLSSINADIVRIEEQLQPIELERLNELLLLKIKQIDEHEKLRPVEVAAPAEALDPEQKKASEELVSINQKIESSQKRSQEIALENTDLAKRQKAITNIREQLRLFQRAFEQAQQTVSDDLKILGITWPDLAVIDIKQHILDEKSAEISKKQEQLKSEAEKIAEELKESVASQQSFTAKLNAPQQQFEAYQQQLSEWNKKLAYLKGSPTEPETKVGLETRIEQIKMLPEQHTELEEKRLRLSGEIFDTLDAQRKAREELFKPVQDLIQKNSLIREDYKLQFQATLAASSEAIADQLFALIKQTWGDFRGQDEAPSTIRKLFDNYDLNSKEGALAFIAALQEKVQEASTLSGATVGIFNLVKKGQSAISVYDLIFGLNFLEPRYSLLFQDTQIEQLSPGQRGALLLIFYLLVDKGKTPIILDQPEENLDNETVFRLLVPVLSEAKKQRQIIMVTHNPNLAVVCDAEQIIYAKFDRADNSTVSYESGAIENSNLNGIVVTILEGTKPAFDNRSGKYH
ncbi:MULTISPECIES: TrlF family AAA-like ATPase [Nitrosomonas]|uniref:ABC transporter n=1 Tax=Nitrosomonas europaea (strain ATCC 19718 / CIP 103999 / KCTC 2705 / NBRC 14298) TaxID=228410 RepID=Q82SK7_NITEU|nr:MULTISPECIES: AAA family ATPase [Nitrosomonas]CAD86222.1 ABC transporter [Nitrosomonas europaea ATCC 19718]SDW30335.1 AAA domain-containing protein, putative AbiEii toxin, Type IV TA system [Nitrosomonas europaea]SES89289.1 AAA domain-containing protein, putative AbiEii toxin, Type IV TA system [Nitrosomonas europaea]SJZ40168.1 AAA domain [Nitrosomonas europaea]HBF25914.1 ABC transporter [Nitrosomonas sp.]